MTDSLVLSFGTWPRRTSRGHFSLEFQRLTLLRRLHHHYCITAEIPAAEYNPSLPKEEFVTQKVIEIVGTSKESFAKAAERAVREAAKTVRGIKWAHIDSLDMLLDGAKVTQYRATAKIYFDVES
jgi:dodecin